MSSTTSFNFQEVDRQRIARELHDTSLQTLAHLSQQCELASLYMDKDIIQAKLELASICDNLDRVIDEIRSVIFDLRPMQFDDLGFKQTIERLADQLKFSSDLKFVLDLDEIYSDDSSMLLNLYRVIQEACNNIIKHANASTVHIIIKNTEDKISISILDDGEGFDVSDDHQLENHYGLRIMRERMESINGSFTIDSEKNKGTKILITLPK